MQIRHLPRHCCPALDNVSSIGLASLEYYTMSVAALITRPLGVGFVKQLTPCDVLYSTVGSRRCTDIRDHSLSTYMCFGCK